MINRKILTGAVTALFLVSTPALMALNTNTNTKRARSERTSRSEARTRSFNRLDTNRDGVIVWNEWRGTEEMFNRLDVNRDRAITKSELKRERSNRARNRDARHRRGGGHDDDDDDDR